MKMPTLNTQIFWGALLGIVIGFLLAQLPPDSGIVSGALYLAGLMGSLFINLLKMLLIPLIFTSVTVGILNLQDSQHMHRIWKMTVLLFLLTMVLALTLGITASNTFHLGQDPAHRLLFQSSTQGFAAAKPVTPAAFFAGFLNDITMNPVSAFAQNNVLSMILLAIAVGMVLVLFQRQLQVVPDLLREGLSITMTLVQGVMMLAPLGIMSLLIKLVATQNIGFLTLLIKFVVVVLSTILIHGLIVLPLMLYFATGITPITFLRGAKSALLTAFATSSSSATLPVTLRCGQENLKLRPEIAGFVLPLGSTVNMDGTALYEAMAALFIANLVGLDLNAGQQLIVCFTALLSAIGAPGIPSAGMVTMIVVLQAVGLPTEGIAILLPIDRFLDTFRTALNVEGDMIVGAIVNAKTAESA